jgi:hypothetical protein
MDGDVLGAADPRNLKASTGEMGLYAFELPGVHQKINQPPTNDNQE